MASTAHVSISIDPTKAAILEPSTSDKNPTSESEKKLSPSTRPLSFVANLKTRMNMHDTKKLAHSVKVGVALVVVSLLYLLDPLYHQVGDNAMWAIMTVVVIFEFYAGATLGKGLNRGIGTILGGGMGCLAASLAQQVGGIGNSIIVGVSVFLFGAAVTYSRLVPSIKKRYDYGAMIFILTFNLVVVSGLRAEKVLELARDRLSTIGIGFAVCIFISLFLFPIWASDELHNSLVSNFLHLAQSIEGCVEEYFVQVGEKENMPKAGSFSSCKSVLNSKNKDEQLANFAKWEPWHGKFGIYYPWGKYLEIGELVRELAASVLSLKICLHSSRQPPSDMRQTIKDPCEAVVSSIAWSLRELGNKIKNMKKNDKGELMVQKLKSMRIELSSIVSVYEPQGQLEIIEGVAIVSFVFLLMEIVDKVEELAKVVEELAELASFTTSTTLG